MFSYSNRLSIIALAAAATLSGCAAGPRPVVDEARFKPIHTITVIYPGQAVYYGSMVSAPIPIPVVGLVGAAIAGAVTGSINAANSKKRVTFDDLVTEKLGDTKLNRRFTDGIEAVLRSHGYIVKEVDASDPSVPRIDWDSHSTLRASGPVYSDGDAILAFKIAPSYTSPGLFYSYSRAVTGEITLFKTATYEPLMRQRLYWQPFSDPYSYATMSMLVKDLPHAISGLDEASLQQVTVFDKALDVAQHKPAAE